MADKDDFIEKVTTELGGGYLAKLDASVLWSIYEKWVESPQNNARMLLECTHEAIVNAIERKKARRILH